MSRSRTGVITWRNGSGLRVRPLYKPAKANRIFNKNQSCRGKKGAYPTIDPAIEERRFLQIGSSSSSSPSSPTMTATAMMVNCCERGTVIQIRPPRRITITTCGSVVQQESPTDSLMYLGCVVLPNFRSCLQISDEGARNATSCREREITRLIEINSMNKYITYSYTQLNRWRKNYQTVLKLGNVRFLE